MVSCRICDKKFKGIKGRNAHIKAHGIKTEEYYHRFHPRYSLLTGKLLTFKSEIEYYNSYFNSKEEMRDWVDKQSAAKSTAEAKRVILNMIEAYMERKRVKAIPGEFWTLLTDCPSIGAAEKVLPDLNERFQFKLNHIKAPKMERYCQQFFIDTREQIPFGFGEAIYTKLEIGDYTAQGDYFDNVYVDRKSPSDFVGTFTSGLDRFKRELGRSISHDAYLYVVVESNLKDMIQMQKKFGRGQLLNLAFRNARQILLESPDHIQFILAGDRRLAQACTQYVLTIGKKGVTYDYQYLVHNNLAPWDY